MTITIINHHKNHYQNQDDDHHPHRIINKMLCWPGMRVNFSDCYHDPYDHNDNHHQNHYHNHNDDHHPHHIIYNMF